MKAEMVLHTIIGEYDILYAQERELCGFLSDKPCGIISTDPAAHLAGTSLTSVAEMTAAQGISPAFEKTNEKGEK